MTGPGCQPPKSADCLSDLALDELIAGDRPSDLFAGHLEGCERCRDRLARLRQEAEGTEEIVGMLVARASLAAREPPTPRANRRPWWCAAGLAGGLATVALVVLITVIPERSPERAKGSAMGFYVQRHGDVIRGVSGERFHAGDALRFTLSTGEAGYFLLAGVEPSGQVSIYYPFEGEQSGPRPPGQDVPLPGSLVLDASPGPELFLGIFSREPVTAREVRRAVALVLAELEPGAPLAQIILVELEIPGTHHWVVIEKGESR